MQSRLKALIQEWREQAHLVRNNPWYSQQGIVLEGCANQLDYILKSKSEKIAPKKRKTK